MSLAKRILGRGETDEASTEINSPTQDDTVAESQDISNAVQRVFDEPIRPAYDMTHEINFSFPETVTITHTGDDDIVTVFVSTPTTDMEFEVRISGYTARFGEVDADYISVGSYAVNVYYPRPEDDKDYFVRRLYYYEDTGGIGGEQHREDSSAPHNPIWVRDEHMNNSVTANETESHLRVYDWREQMLTHDKPTPKDGEVVFRYQDSPNSGGNRNRENIILNVNDIQTPVQDSFSIEYICVDEDTGQFKLYGKVDEQSWHIASLPIQENLNLSDISWETKTEFIRPSKLDNLVWVRRPADTWFVSTEY